MRLVWLIGGLTLLASSTGCCCGSCGWGKSGREYPAATYQASTPPQYGTAGTYASTPPGAALGNTAMADGSMSPAGNPTSGASGGMSPGGSSVESASYGMPVSE